MTIQQYQDSGADQGAFTMYKKILNVEEVLVNYHGRNQLEQHIQSAANLQGTLDELLTKTLSTDKALASALQLLLYKRFSKA